MLIRSQNHLGYANLENLAYIHVINGDVSRGRSSTEWRIQAKVANSNQEIVLGAYPSEDACIDVMEKLENAYIESSTVSINERIGAYCFPRTTVFNMPPENDYTSSTDNIKKEDER